MSDDNGAGGLGWFLARSRHRSPGGRSLRAESQGEDAQEELMASALDAKERAAEHTQQGRERASAVCREQAKSEINEYVDRGKEYYDRGRTQWSQYVEKGKGLCRSSRTKSPPPSMLAKAGLCRARPMGIREPSSSS